MALEQNVMPEAHHCSVGSTGPLPRREDRLLGLAVNGVDDRRDVSETGGETNDRARVPIMGVDQGRTLATEEAHELSSRAQAVLSPAAGCKRSDRHVPDSPARKGFPEPA